MRVYLWETKTTSEDIGLGSTFWKRTLIDPQLSLYIPALRVLRYDPLGAIYDVLRKPTLRPSDVPNVDNDGIKIVLDRAGQRVRTKDGKKWRQTADTKEGYALQTRPETPEEYGHRCLAAIAESPDKYYQRGKPVRLEEEELESATDTWQTAVQMRDAKRKSESLSEKRRLTMYPRNQDSCVSWGRECDYLDVCSRIATIDDPILFKNEPAHVELDPGEGNLSDDLSLLTQSSMRCYRSCQRKFYYRYILRQRPLAKPETLSTGTSIHNALEVYRKTVGDMEAAKKTLVTDDLFVRAKEEAMLVGYAARWGAPVGFIEIEHQFRIALVNPETGAASRTFSLGGKVDAIVDAERVDEYMVAGPVVAPEASPVEVCDG
jgi:hypothetical protein